MGLGNGGVDGVDFDLGAVLKANLESDVYMDFIQKYRFILDFKIPKSTEVLINSNR